MKRCLIFNYENIGFIYKNIQPNDCYLYITMANNPNFTNMNM